MAKLRLSKESTAALTQILQNLTGVGNVRDALFYRNEYIDRCLMREANRDADHIQARLAKRNGNRKVMGDVEIPTTLAQIDTAHARLCGMFLSGSPIIGCTSENPDLLDSALMLNTLSKRDQSRFAWGPQLSGALRDALCYLYNAVEVNYEKRTRGSIKTKAGANDSNSEIVSADYQGNSIRRLDVYNVFFDTTVPLSEVHSKGVFAGYVERLNYINTKQLLQDLTTDFALTHKFSEALSSTTPTNLYKRPDCAQPDDASSNQGANWGVFWGSAARNASVDGHSGKFEKVVLYVKLIPQEYQLATERSGTPTIFKLIWINGILIYVEPLQNAHGMLPIVIGSGSDDNLQLQSKSSAEHLTDFQEILSALVNATFTSMRRAVGDRALYDPQRIKSTDIDSANPTAKIPVRLNQFNKDLSSAYYAIPYRDEITPYFTQNFGFMQAISQQVTGLNPAAQGNFVKGNKTQTEYSDVQSNSDARTQKFGMNLEATMFGPIKYMLKMNYLQFAKDEQLVDQASATTVQVDINKLRNSELEFDMTDGVTPASKVMSHDMMMTAMNAIAQMPQMDIEYSRPKILASILKSSGLNIDKYKRTPQEQQQYMQMMQPPAAPGAPTK